MIRQGDDLGSDMPSVPLGSLDFMLFDDRNSDLDLFLENTGWFRITNGMLDAQGLVLYTGIRHDDQASTLTIGSWPNAPGARLQVHPTSVDVTSDAEGSLHVSYAVRGRRIIGTRGDLISRYQGGGFDVQAFEELLALNFVLDNNTLDENVKRLNALQKWTATSSEDIEVIDCPWIRESVRALSPEEAMTNLSRWTAQKCDSGAMLEMSAGYDSRIVLALAIHGGAESIRGFTLGKLGMVDPDGARMLAEKCSIDHLVLPHEDYADPTDVNESTRLMQQATNFLVNAADYSMFPQMFMALDGVRDGQINGLGGEKFIGFYDTPMDSAFSKVKASRFLWYRYRVLSNAHLFDRLWPRKEAARRLNGVLERLDRFIMGFDGPWRERLKKFYGRMKLKNWGSAVITASGRWYEPASPLWSMEFENWSMSSPDHVGRNGQVMITNKLAPVLESIPYQDELERNVEYSSQMGNRSNSLFGKVMLRLLRKRWTTQPEIAQVADGYLNDEEFMSDIRELQNIPELGGFDLSNTFRGNPMQEAHAIGVLLSAALANQNMQDSVN